MDFFYWGGPVYCKQANNLVWRRETKVFCNPQEGSSNGDYFYGLGKDPLNNLLSLRAKIDPATVGSIGFGGFSAFHQFLNPMLKIPEACKRIDYVHLADACFQGAGATNPHTGYVAFAKRAAAGEARMTITTNGPWGKNISYAGPAGSKYAGQQFNLISGAKCIEMVWQTVVGAPKDVSVDVPPGIPQPTRTFRSGQLYWFHYESGLSDPHGSHANELAQPYMQMYGVPWMGGERGGLALPTGQNLLVAGIFAALGFLGVRWFRSRNKAVPNAIKDQMVYYYIVDGPIRTWHIVSRNKALAKAKAKEIWEEDEEKYGKAFGPGFYFTDSGAKVQQSTVCTMRDFGYRPIGDIRGVDHVKLAKEMMRNRVAAMKDADSW